MQSLSKHDRGHLRRRNSAKSLLSEDNIEFLISNQFVLLRWGKRMMVPIASSRRHKYTGNEMNQSWDGTLIEKQQMTYPPRFVAQFDKILILWNDGTDRGQSPPFLWQQQPNERKKERERRRESYNTAHKHTVENVRDWEREQQPLKWSQN